MKALEREAEVVESERKRQKGSRAREREAREGVKSKRERQKGSRARKKDR